MASTSGRKVIVPLTNKSGGGVIAGDVVVIDSANDDAFTTSTAGAVTTVVGIAQETIASNAVGPVLISGEAALVTVNASVTRGNYGTTHTVAKQATDAGASRVVGAFCQFKTGGTTPKAILFGFPDASSASGNMATDALWDAAGDLAVGTGANTAHKLTAGAAGTVLTSAGAADPTWSNPHVGLVPIVTPHGFDPSGTSTMATAQIGFAMPVSIHGVMALRNMVARYSANGSGNVEWGLFDYSASATAATKLAGGSAAPGGTGWRSIAAASAPVTIQPGNYMFVVFNPTSNQSTFFSNNSAAAGTFNKAQTTYTWDDTPDFTTGWAASSINLVAYLQGDIIAGTQW